MTSLLHTPKLQLIDMACIKASKEEHAFNVEEVFNKMSEQSNDITIIGKDGEQTSVNRLLLGVSSPTLRPIIFDQLNITPTIFLPDISSSTIKHLVNLITAGSSIAQTIAFKELHEITEAAKLLGIDLTDIAWESINYKPKVMIKQVENVEVSEIDVVHNIADGHNESIQTTEQSHENEDKTLVKVGQSSINSIPFGTDDQTFLIADQVKVNDKEDVKDYQDTNEDHQVDVMDDQSNGNFWKNEASLTDSKVDIEVMDDQDIGNIMNYQPSIMSDKVNDVVGQAKVSFNDNLVYDMDHNADNQISANVVDNQGNVNVPDDQVSVDSMGDVNNIELLGVMDDQPIVQIMSDKVPVIGGLTNVGDQINVNMKDDLNVNMKDDQVGDINDQANAVGDETNVKMMDNEVSVMSPSKNDQADVNNYQTCDIVDDQVSVNHMNDEAYFSTVQTNVKGEPASFMVDQPNFIGDQTTFMGVQTSFKVEQIGFTGDQTSFMSDSVSLMGDQPNFMGNDTPILNNQTSVTYNQVELKCDPARTDKLYQNSIIVNDLPDVKNAEINIKSEKISFGVCSPFKNDLVKAEVGVKNEVVENLMKEDNKMETSFNSLNELNNSFETVHEISVSMSDKNIKANTDNNFESSLNSVSDFDSSFETLNENSMDISDENVALKSVCQVCSKEENNYSILKTHYVGSHFANEMKSQFGDLIVEKTHGAKKYQYCVVCNARFTSIRMALRHIGISHNKLNEILILEGLTPLPDKPVNLGGASKRKAEKEEELTKKVKADSAKNIENLLSDGDQLPEMNIKESTPEIETSNIEEVSVKEIEQSQVFDLKIMENKQREDNMTKGESILKSTCQICSKSEKVFNLLLNHYCNDHFSEQLMEDFGDLVSDNICLLCSKRFGSPIAVFRHVGISHGRLNEILESKGLLALPLTPKIKSELDSAVTGEVENSKHNLEGKVNDHEKAKNESQEERIKINNRRNISGSEAKASIEGVAEYTENLIADQIRADEMPSEIADSSVCQICQKTENPGLALWNHYINSHYSSKRIVQEFGNMVRKKKCLVCNSKHSGSAAALKHVAVKHEKLNDLLILDGLVPLPGIGPKATQEFNFGGTVQVDGAGQSKPLTKNNPVPENVSNNYELKPLKTSVIEEQPIVNEKIMMNKKLEVVDTHQTNVENSTHPNDSSINDDEIENDDVKDPLVCQICNVKKSNILLLQKHYINSHFTRKIKSRFEHLIIGNYCENCDIEFRSTIKGLIHVGIEHNKLNEILDEEGYLVLLPPKDEASEVKSLDSKNVESEESDKFHTEKEKPNPKTDNISKVDLRSSTMQLEHNGTEMEGNFKKQIIEKEESVKFVVESKKESVTMPSRGIEERNVTTNTNPLAKFTCDVCNEKFDKKNYFIRHTLSNRHYFTCDNCETNFRKKDKFDTHKSVCPAMKEEAKNGFQNNSDDKTNIGFDQHKKLTTEPNGAHDITKSKVAFKEPVPVMKIKTDPVPFTNKANIEPITQMRTERKRSVTVTEITCEICGEKFNNKKIFFRHCLMKNHYFTCDVCGKSFKKRVEYTAHQQNCTM